MDSLNKVTIILFLKDRFEFTPRWLKHLESYHLKSQIFIADGSISNEAEIFFKTFSNVNILYKRYPPDNNLQDFYLKFSSIIGLVNTEYVLLADNDDFFIFDELPKFITFLDNNSEYVSCGAQQASLNLFDLYYNKVKSPIGVNYFATFFTHNKSIIEIDPIARLRRFAKFCNNELLWSNWYNLHRTKTILKCSESMLSTNFKEIVISELLFHLVLLKDGLSKSFNTPFYVRQEGTSQVTAKLNHDDPLSARINSPKSISEFKLLLKYLEEVFISIDSKELSEVLEIWNLEMQTLDLESIKNESNFFVEVIRKVKIIIKSKFPFLIYPNRTFKYGRIKKLESFFLKN